VFSVCKDFGPNFMQGLVCVRTLRKVGPKSKVALFVFPCMRAHKEEQRDESRNGPPQAGGNTKKNSEVNRAIPRLRQAAAQRRNHSAIEMGFSIECCENFRGWTSDVQAWTSDPQCQLW